MRKPQSYYPTVSCLECRAVMRVHALERHLHKHGTALDRLTVPSDDQALICHLYRSGKSIRGVAKATFYGATTVRKVLIANNVRLRPQGYSNKLITTNEALRRTELYGQGMSLLEVARACGVTREAVRQTLIREGVQLRGKENLRWVRQRASSPASREHRAMAA